MRTRAEHELHVSWDAIVASQLMRLVGEHLRIVFMCFVSGTRSIKLGPE